VAILPSRDQHARSRREGQVASRRAAAVIIDRVTASCSRSYGFAPA
jgi:hypothetical protein